MCMIEKIQENCQMKILFPSQSKKEKGNSFSFFLFLTQENLATKNTSNHIYIVVAWIMYSKDMP